MRSHSWDPTAYSQGETRNRDLVGAPSRSQGRSSSRETYRHLRKRANLSKDTHSRSRSRSPPRNKYPRSRKGKEPCPQSWADIISEGEEEPIDYNTPLHFEDSDEEDTPGLIEVSEKTSKFLSQKCTQRVSNQERLKIRQQYPSPKVPATRTPQLDSYIKQEVSSGVKGGDKHLVRIQTFVLDALAPLTSLVETHNKGECLKEKEVLKAVTAAMELIGNASSNISRIRREKVVLALNKALLPITADDSNFKEAAPALFGKNFANQSKELIDQVKAMRFSLPGKSGTGRRSFFRNGPPQTVGGLWWEQRFQPPEFEEQQAGRERTNPGRNFQGNRQN